MIVPLNLAMRLLSKWTAATPHHKEKHFVITRLIQPQPPVLEIEFVDLEAVYSQQNVSLSWRAETETSANGCKGGGDPVLNEAHLCKRYLANSSTQSS